MCVRDQVDVDLAVDGPVLLVHDVVHRRSAIGVRCRVRVGRVAALADRDCMRESAAGESAIQAGQEVRRVAALAHHDAGKCGRRISYTGRVGKAMHARSWGRTVFVPGLRVGDEAEKGEGAQHCEGLASRAHECCEALPRLSNVDRPRAARPLPPEREQLGQKNCCTCPLFHFTCLAESMAPEPQKPERCRAALDTTW